MDVDTVNHSAVFAGPIFKHCNPQNINGLRTGYNNYGWDGTYHQSNLYIFR